MNLYLTLKMNKLEDLYQKIVEDWRLKARGKGIINFTNKVNYMPVVLGVLQRIYERDPTFPCVIITDNNLTKQNVINYITNTDDVENNKEFKKLIQDSVLRIRDVNLANSWMPKENIYLTIFVGVNSSCNAIRNILFVSKFKLVCCKARGDLFTKRKDLTEIGVNEVKELSEIYKNTPVEETQIGITITDEKDIELINKYTEYIIDSVKIFGSFEVMSYAKNGNSLCNISAMQICEDIAKQNGWHENLDMSVSFNKQIDAYYNPNTLKDRVDLTYNLIRKRAKLVCENNAKLDVILQIVKDNINKRILIVNKSSEFAKTVTNYLNNNLCFSNVGLRNIYSCYNYHLDVDKVPAYDIYGNPIYVKSGANKGEQRMLAARAQMTEAEDFMNSGIIRILSTNNSPDKSLSCDIDILIISSASCELYENYKYRLSNVNFSGNPFKVYRLYCYGTMEERDLSKQKPNINYTIVNNSKNEVKYDENLGVIVG